eukprot:2963261-Rhodomonas_salina.1
MAVGEALGLSGPGLGCGERAESPAPRRLRRRELPPSLLPPTLLFPPTLFPPTPALPPALLCLEAITSARPDHDNGCVCQVRVGKAVAVVPRAMLVLEMAVRGSDQPAYLRSALNLRGDLDRFRRWCGCLRGY